MYIRYTCREGDKTSSGGIVDMEGQRPMRVDGRTIALEHDSIRCPACQSTGRIVCVGPRANQFTIFGRSVALSDDECACLCSPRPKLIASQDKHAHVCGEKPAGTTPLPSAAHRAAATVESADQPFQLCLQACDASGRPHADLRYATGPSATPSQPNGSTNAEGQTRQVAHTSPGTVNAAFGTPSMETTA
jgi:uncharacterized Zn-binding protein involved in type VI secretion